MIIPSVCCVEQVFFIVCCIIVVIEQKKKGTWADEGGKKVQKGLLFF